MFCFIGLATSSLYFSSLITCARICPDHKGLAISLPITCYGLSALLGAQILKLPYFHRHDVLDLEVVFLFLHGFIWSLALLVLCLVLLLLLSWSCCLGLRQMRKRLCLNLRQRDRSSRLTTARGLCCLSKTHQHGFCLCH